MLTAMMMFYTSKGEIYILQQVYTSKQNGWVSHEWAYCDQTV